MLLGLQVQAEQALQNITAAMEQASGHRQEAALLKKQLADDQVKDALHTSCDRQQHESFTYACSHHACTVAQSHVDIFSSQSA